MFCRYLKTVANPAAAAAAHLEREVLQLRHNRIGPGEAPIPLPRSVAVAIPTPRPPAAAAGAGAGSSRTPGTGGSGGGRGRGLPAKRKAPEAAGRAGGGAGQRGCVLLECDLFEDDARQQAVELVRAMGELRAAGGGAYLGCTRVLLLSWNTLTGQYKGSWACS